jgi:RHS repeat-associated protein
MERLQRSLRYREPILYRKGGNSYQVKFVNSLISITYELPTGRKRPATGGWPPVLRTIPNEAEGAPGPSPLGTGDGGRLLGHVATVTYPNGVQSTFTYDTLNRVTGLSSQPASYTYQRGPTGNLTSAAESSGRTVSWNYDGIYRLTNETISLAPNGHNGNVGYGLDPVGNRLSESSSLEGIPPGSWNFNADDELSSETYDQNGNVTATGGKSFTYDSENHLVLMSESGTSASIIYDGDGNRVAKTVTVNGVPTTTYYLVDDLNPTGYPQVVDELTNGAVTRTYTYGLQRIDQNQLVSNVWTPSFYGYDGGGNVRQLTSIAGTVTDSYEYDAYGNSFTVSGSTPNEMMYRGEQYDPDLGLYYLRARYCNPLTGRFMSRDPNEPQLLDRGRVPADPQTLHKYLYANGDPVNGIDPDGRVDLFDFGSVLVRTLEEVGGPEALVEVEDEILLCTAYDLWMEELADLKFPVWYCEVGSR